MVEARNGMETSNEREILEKIVIANLSAWTEIIVKQMKPALPCQKIVKISPKNDDFLPKKIDNISTCFLSSDQG